MKVRKQKWALVAALILIVGTAIALAATAVRLQSVAETQRQKERTALLTPAIEMQNNSLHYLHTSWMTSTYRFKAVRVSSITEVTGTSESTETLEVLSPRGGFADVPKVEVPVRGQASALYATALALGNGTYNASHVGVSREEALRRVVAWTNALAISYQRDGWAGSWQAPLWVYYLSFGAHEVWPSIPPVTKELIRRAVVSEADRLLTIPPPYYRDMNGTVLFKGDSKSEEDAWNGVLLLLASCEYPDNRNAEAWSQQGCLYMLTAYATPSQATQDSRIAGSNLNENGTVTNHGKINPDYMFSGPEMMVKCDLMCTAAKIPTPAECHNNLLLIWHALTQLEFKVGNVYEEPGGTIYRTDRTHSPTAEIYYPEGADWSAKRRFNAAGADVEVWALNLDSSAYGFAKAHLNYTLALQARHSSGKTFSRYETRYPVEEQFIAATAAEIVSRLQLAH